MGDIYLIKDLANTTGHSIETVKYYLKIGLIKELGKTPNTNFRYFDGSAVKVLNRIRMLRTENMSIAQIREILKEGKEK